MAWWTSQNLHPKTKSKFIVCFGTDFYLPNVKSIVKPKIEFDTKEFRLINHKFNYPGNGTWQPVEIKFVDMNGLGRKDKQFDTSAFLWQILNNSGYAYPYLNADSDISKNAYYKNVVTTDNDGQSTTAVVEGQGHHVATQIAFRDDPRTRTQEDNSFKSFTTPEKASTIANAFGDGLGGTIGNQSGNYASQKVSIYQISPEHPDDDGAEIKKGAIISEAWHLINPIVKTISWGDLAYESDELVEYSLTIVYDWAIFDRSSIGERLDVSSQTVDEFMNKFRIAQDQINKEVNIQQNLATLQAQARESTAFDAGSEAFNELEKEGRFEDKARIIEGEGRFIKNEDTGRTFFDANMDGEIDEVEALIDEGEVQRLQDEFTQAEGARELVNSINESFSEAVETAASQNFSVDMGNFGPTEEEILREKRKSAYEEAVADGTVGSFLESDASREYRDEVFGGSESAEAQEYGVQTDAQVKRVEELYQREKQKALQRLRDDAEVERLKAAYSLTEEEAKARVLGLPGSATTTESDL